MANLVCLKNVKVKISNFNLLYIIVFCINARMLILYTNV